MMDRSELLRHFRAMLETWDKAPERDSPGALGERLLALVDVYAGRDERFVSIRGTLGRVTRDMGDSQKLMKAEITIYNTKTNAVALALLDEAAVDIIGTQADLEGVQQQAVEKLDKALTDLEQYAAEHDPGEQLRRLLPSDEILTALVERSRFEEWWADDLAPANVEEAAWMGAHAGDKGAPMDDNPFKADISPEYRQAWEWNWKRAQELGREIHELAQAKATEEGEGWPGEGAEGAEAQAPSNGRSYVGMTKAQLRAELEGLGVEVPAQATKDVLIEALRHAAQKLEPEEEPAEAAVA